jgi:hypothetical protein
MATKTQVSGKCPECGADGTLHLVVNQGDCMRVADVNRRAAVKVVVNADIFCANREGPDGWCEYRIHMEPREIGFKAMRTER